MSGAAARTGNLRKKKDKELAVNRRRLYGRKPKT